MKINGRSIADYAARSIVEALRAFAEVDAGVVHFYATAPQEAPTTRGFASILAQGLSGLTAQQVADDIGVHRTIAYRLLSTLSQFRLVAKGEDGRYRSAAALA